MEKTLADIKSEFDGLSQVYDQLVGSLYPPIVYEKLIKLRQKYRDMGGNDKDLRLMGLVWAPKPSGHRL